MFKYIVAISLFCSIATRARSQFALTKNGFVDSADHAQSYIVRTYPTVNSEELYKLAGWYFPNSKFKVLEKSENNSLVLKSRKRINLGHFKYTIFETFYADLNGYVISMEINDEQIKYSIPDIYWDAPTFNYLFRIRVSGKDNVLGRVRHIWNSEGERSKKWGMIVEPTELIINKVISDFHNYIVKSYPVDSNDHEVVLP